MSSRGGPFVLVRFRFRHLRLEMLPKFPAKRLMLPRQLLARLFRIRSNCIDDLFSVRDLPNHCSLPFRLTPLTGATCTVYDVYMVLSENTLSIRDGYVLVKNIV